MALTRKMLKAMGIEDEKIDEIIEAHSETVDGIKTERDNFKKNAEKLAEVEKELDNAKKQLAKNGEGETVSKDDYDKLKKELDDYKADVGAKEALQAKQTAFRELAKNAGISEKGIEKAVKYADYNKIELDRDGKIKDAEKHSDDIKAEWSDYVETTSMRGANTAHPPIAGSGGKMTKADIYKKDENGRYILTTEERQKALVENQIQ